MEKFFADKAKEYRDKIASEITAAPKENRKDMLSAVKAGADYWDARTQSLKGRQEGNDENEQVIDDGLALFINHKTLYHGTADAGITEFIDRENDATNRTRTLGVGVYLTSEGRDAFGYGNVRAEQARVHEKRTMNALPQVYEVSIDKLKLIDFRNRNNIVRVASGLRNFIQNGLDERKRNGQEILWYENAKIEFIDEILEHPESIKSVRNLFKASGESVYLSEYCKSLGYDGLIAVEGGEGGNGKHDTYLIFDFKKVKIMKEQEIVQKV